MSILEVPNSDTEEEVEEDDELSDQDEEDYENQVSDEENEEDEEDEENEEIEEETIVEKLPKRSKIDYKDTGVTIKTMTTTSTNQTRGRIIESISRKVPTNLSKEPTVSIRGITSNKPDGKKDTVYILPYVDKNLDTLLISIGDFYTANGLM